MNNFRRLNLGLGWLTFAIASFVYISTIEPTTSFWDCGEFITSAYKLEVGHPPGAPFFMILGRVFTLFSFGDVTQVAKMVNIMSALASAFTILFLFWTITHITRRAVAGYREELTHGELATIMGSGLVGALAFTFSDTFWFSAAEGEVYALSSLFTAIVFWAILKWENEAGKPYANRWLIFIAYLMGLSIGVHLLNLLAIPAIVFIYYFRNYKTTKRGVLAAAGISVALLLTLMYGVIQGVVWLASRFELLFVNSFGLPYNSGTLFYIVLLIILMVYGIYWARKKGKVIAHTALSAFAVILIGYSSFALIMIRSLADTPMNQNEPNNLFALQSYLNREQYGSTPLLHGKYFNADVVEYEDGKPVYYKEDGKYKIADYKVERKFKNSQTTFFPRMYSDQSAPDHIGGYMEWTELPNRQAQPSFADNLEFFFQYQLNFMYIRYFMWNFSGRQNDIQGHGEVIHGNWISGIPFIDNPRLGDQSKLPDYLKNNRARNRYFMFPLLFGLLGLFFHYQKDRKNFWIVMLLFFFTGIAIVLYLNQPPYQPRERDYAYAGSFYAFAIWIGMGVFGLVELLRNVMPRMHSAAVATGILLFLVPGIMATENWDDHDRSDRYTAREFAKNYLRSCEPNAIIFTNGDNDTFPLWYVQEVEGFRTDVKVINMSYLNTDWYAHQMTRKTYEAPPVPFSMTIDKYRQGTRDAVFLQDRTKKHVELKTVINYIASDDMRTKRVQGDRVIYFAPTRRFKITIDSAHVIKTNTVQPEDANLMVKQMRWALGKNKSYISKSEMMLLDLLAHNDWNRPVYYAVTVGRSAYLNLQSFFQLDGMSYRIVPIQTKSKPGRYGHINTDILYENMMNKFDLGGITDPNVYLDENNVRMLMNMKNNYGMLARELIAEGDKARALKVMDRVTKTMPNERVPYNFYNLMMSENLFKLGEDERAVEMLKTLARNKAQELQYFYSLPPGKTKRMQREMQRSPAVLQQCNVIAQQYGKAELSKWLENNYGALMPRRQ